MWLITMVAGAHLMGECVKLYLATWKCKHEPMLTIMNGQPLCGAVFDRNVLL